MPAESPPVTAELPNPGAGMKRDIVLNTVTAVWIAALGFALTPVFVAKLGVEAYGLIGLLAALQASFGLFDLGLSQVLGREFARFAAGAIPAQSIRDLLRSSEVVALVIAFMTASAIALGAPTIAQSWLKPGAAATPGLAQTIEIMGLLVALRMLEGLHRSALTGLGRQTALNVITLATMTARGVGGVLVVLLVSPTVSALFLWQAAVSAATVALLAATVYAALPERALRGRPSIAPLRSVGRFAGGVTGVSLLSLILTQTDKVLLSNLLPLAAYGAYTLAGTLAFAPITFIPPITQAAQPRLASAVARGSRSELAAILHNTTQLLTVLVGSAAIVLAIYPHEVLMLWLGDRALADSIAPVVRLLTLASLCGTYAYMTYFLQLAHGATGVTLRLYIVAVVALLIVLPLVAPVLGARGAAMVWLAVQAALFGVTTSLVFPRFLAEARGAFLIADIAVPLAAALVVAAIAKPLFPDDATYAIRAGFIMAVSAATLLAALAAAPRVRSAAIGLVGRIHETIASLLARTRTPKA